MFYERSSYLDHVLLNVMTLRKTIMISSIKTEKYCLSTEGKSQIARSK